MNIKFFELYDPNVPIDDVIVGDRIRKDYGDLGPLIRSIAERGLMQPIAIVSDGNRLLFGGRRLEACRQSGWTTIPAVWVHNQQDALKMALAERDENTCRKDMTTSELVEMGLRIEELEKPKARERQAQGLRAGPQLAPAESRSAQLGGTEAKHPKETREVVAEALGISRSTYERAKGVVNAANDDSLSPEVQQAAKEAVIEMNKTGVVSAASEKVKEAKAKAQPPEQPVNPREVIKIKNLKQIAEQLYGYQTGFDGITAVDPKLRGEEAADLYKDLGKSISAINRIRKLVRERIAK